MATTSITLGPHWETFIKAEVESGRYASASEVIRAALRELEDRGKRLDALKSHLADGLAQADRGEFVDDFDIGNAITAAKTKARTKS